MDKTAFGKKLNMVRKEKHITSEALSEMCDLTAVFIRQIESAARMPSISTLVTICNALKVSPGVLLADSLETNEEDDFAAVWNKLRLLTPKQIGIVSAMVDTLIEKIDE